MEVRMYPVGQAFLDKFRSLMEDRFPESCYMIENSPTIKSLDDGYSISVMDTEGRVLLAQCRRSYKLTLTGDKRLVGELCRFLRREHIPVTGVLAEESLAQEFARRCNLPKLRERLQYMEYPVGSVGSLYGVSFAEESDIEDIALLVKQYRTECNVEPSLPMTTITQQVQKVHTQYGVYKVDGRVVSQARLARDTGTYMCITGAITVPEHRGNGYMRKVISFLAAEVWRRGEVPYLFAVEGNPISSHLYSSIGFINGIRFAEYEVQL